MIYLVYVSSATKLMKDSELLELLSKCKNNNAQNDITGMLLYKHGNFMQALEGPEDVVMHLYKKISKDPRHTNVMTLLTGELESRQFGTWSMAFQNVDLLSDSAREAYSPFLKEPFTEEYFGQNPHNALKLLLSFKKRM